MMDRQWLKKGSMFFFYYYFIQMAAVFNFLVGSWTISLRNILHMIPSVTSIFCIFLARLQWGKPLCAMYKVDSAFHSLETQPIKAALVV